MFLFDANAHKIIEFNPDGALLGTRVVEELGLTIVALQHEVVMTTVVRRQLFTILDATGVEIESMEHPLQAVAKNQLGLAGVLAPVSDERWLYAPQALPMWSIVDRNAGVIMTAETVDRRSMKHVLDAPETNGNATRFPRPDVYLHGAWVQNERVFLHLYDRTDLDAMKSWLDIYVVNDGSYVGRIPLPRGQIALDGEDLFISSDSGVDRWRLAPTN